MLQHTAHSAFRSAQRGLTDEEIEYVYEFGSRYHRAGALIYYLRERDVPARDPAGRIRDRLGHVIALNQDRVQARDRSPLLRSRRGLERPGPLQQQRHARKHAGREPLGRRRFAHREPNLALRVRKAGHRIHHQHDILALVAEELRRGARHEGRADAQQGRLVPRRHDHERPRGPLGTEEIGRASCRERA